ncbi:MAG: mechanosensitive ion channel [Nitrospirae bacterium]|nr:MAG: mechanosensitive ion channel [Nitrospirota bacterium]
MAITDHILDLLVTYGFQVLGALAILGLGLVLARWVGNALQRVLQQQDMEPPVRMLLVRLARGLVLLFVLLTALEKLGVQIGPFLAGIGVVGLGVGIAMQGVLSDMIAGLTIIFTKPYRVGEYIELIGVEGQVAAISIFSTTLAHADRSRVVIPNRKVIGEVLHNFGDVRQLKLTVGVAYGADVNKALTVVRGLVLANPRVLKEPVPLVGIAVLADSAITVSIQPWVKVADYLPAQAELYRTIVEEFRAQRIDIPFPQQEVRLLGPS